MIVMMRKRGHYCYMLHDNQSQDHDIGRPLTIVQRTVRTEHCYIWWPLTCDQREDHRGWCEDNYCDCGPHIVTFISDDNTDKLQHILTSQPSVLISPHLYRDNITLLPSSELTPSTGATVQADYQLKSKSGALSVNPHHWVLHQITHWAARDQIMRAVILGRILSADGVTRKWWLDLEEGCCWVLLVR